MSEQKPYIRVATLTISLTVDGVDRRLERDLPDIINAMKTVGEDAADDLHGVLDLPFDVHVRNDLEDAREVTRRFNQALANSGLYRREPRYVYWSNPKTGVLFCYNTTAVSGGDGRWFSWEYAPVAKGSRRMEMRNRVKHATRTKAKARAYARYWASVKTPASPR